ncbi:MAG: sugar porter family MFS transporter [Francisellaceae bacterium]
MITGVRMKKNGLLWMVICIPALGNLLHGYEIGIIAGAMAAMKHSIVLSGAEHGFIVGAAFYGASLSMLIAGPLADWIGRKSMLIFGAFLISLGLISIGMADGYYGVLWGRLLQGVGVGFVTLVIPMYIAECTPAHVRGSGTTTVQFFLNGGILLAAFFAYLLSQEGLWREMFFYALIPSVMLFFLAFSLPKSPRWLVGKGRMDEARVVLASFGDKIQVDNQLAVIKKSHARHKTNAFSALWRRKNLLAVLLVIAVGSLNMLTGINNLLSFAPVILKQMGIESERFSVFGTVIITGINFVMAFIAVMLVDKVGRKPLLKTGLVGMIIACLIMSGSAYFMAESPMRGYVVLGAILMFVTFFAIGPGSMIWLLLSELVPNEVRGIGMSLSLCILLFVAGSYSASFLDLADAFGYGAVFLFCAVVCILYFIIIHYFVPETNGKSLEEI